jgi:hypothetical protein
VKWSEYVSRSRGSVPALEPRGIGRSAPADRDRPAPAAPPESSDGSGRAAGCIAFRRQGLAIIIAITRWGASIVAFGLSGDLLVLALSCLVVAGGADVGSAVLRSTIPQDTVSDDRRGRWFGIHVTVVGAGARIGDVEAGFVAAVFMPTVSVVSSVVPCVAGRGLLALLVPELARYQRGAAKMRPTS